MAWLRFLEQGRKDRIQPRHVLVTAVVALMPLAPGQRTSLESNITKWYACAVGTGAHPALSIAVI